MMNHYESNGIEPRKKRICCSGCGEFKAPKYFDDHDDGSVYRREEHNPCDGHLCGSCRFLERKMMLTEVPLQECAKCQIPTRVDLIMIDSDHKTEKCIKCWDPAFEMYASKLEDSKKEHPELVSLFPDMEDTEEFIKWPQPGTAPVVEANFSLTRQDLSSEPVKDKGKDIVRDDPLLRGHGYIKSRKAADSDNEDVARPEKKAKLEERNIPYDFRDQFAKEAARVCWEANKIHLGSYNSFISHTLCQSNLSMSVTPDTTDFEELKNEFVSRGMGADSNPVACVVCKQQGEFFFSATGHAKDYRICWGCVIKVLRESKPAEGVTCPLCEGDSKHTLKFPFFHYSVGQSAYAAVVNQLKADKM
eukprot:jgi/Mesvir1/15557/Mv26139-RA.1